MRNLDFWALSLILSLRISSLTQNIDLFILEDDYNDEP